MLPSGEVSFVFTDIEGSTRLFQRAGDDYAGLLATHFALIREAFNRAHGHEVRTIGDSMFAVFESALDAVTACVDAQRSLLAHPWPAEHPLRVRMGIHTGTASPTGDDYVAIAVHQAARVETAARGGQILASSATIDALGGRLPPMVDIVDLGIYWLRDFDEPQRLFAVRHPDAPAVEPAPRTPSATATNLPRPRTSFVGRDDELAALRKALLEERLVTVVGPGGVGKTRAAIEVASESGPRFPSGIWFVDLARVEDGALVGPALASTLGARPRPGQDPIDAVIAAAGEDAVLVVFDNCEHVIETAASVVDRLLAGCAAVAVLATSRVPLRVEGEQVLRLSPLPSDDAVRLFADRARHAALGFELAHVEDAGHVAEICKRLDGLPLALELAAARVGDLSIAELHAAVAERFESVGAGLRTAPMRQQTLDALVRWSWDLLAPEDQAVMRRVCVCRGGFPARAAEVLTTTEGIEPVLAKLVDRSLLVQVDERYSMLETIRSFARERAEDAGEVDESNDRLVEWIADLAQVVADATYFGGEFDALHALDDEQGNVAVALQRVIEAPSATGRRLALAMQAYWFTHGVPNEQVYWLDRLVPAFADDGQTHFLLRMRRGSVLAMVGQLAPAKEDLESALDFFAADVEDVDPALAGRLPLYLFQARASLGLLAAREGRPDDAIDLLRAALEESPLVSATTDTVTTRLNLGAVLVDTGRIEEGAQEVVAAIASADENGLHVAGMLGRSNLATIRMRQGLPDEALPLYEAVLAERREHGDRGGAASTLANMADLGLQTGDLVSAVEWVAESMTIAAEVGLTHVLAVDLLTCAEIAAAVARFDESGWFIGVRSVVAAGLPPALVNHPAVAELSARVEEAGLDASAWQAAVDEGAAVPAGTVVARAVERVQSLTTGAAGLEPRKSR